MNTNKSFKELRQLNLSSNSVHIKLYHEAGVKLTEHQVDAAELLMGEEIGSGYFVGKINYYHIDKEGRVASSCDPITVAVRSIKRASEELQFEFCSKQPLAVPVTKTADSSAEGESFAVLSVKLDAISGVFRWNFVVEFTEYIQIAKSIDLRTGKPSGAWVGGSHYNHVYRCRETGSTLSNLLAQEYLAYDGFKHKPELGFDWHVNFPAQLKFSHHVFSGAVCGIGMRCFSAELPDDYNFAFYVQEEHKKELLDNIQNAGKEASREFLVKNFLIPADSEEDYKELDATLCFTLPNGEHHERPVKLQDVMRPALHNLVLEWATFFPKARAFNLRIPKISKTEDKD